MVRLVELDVDESCDDVELYARMSQSSKARHAHHYVATDDGSEVAFLALDQIPDVDYLVLYEIFVQPGCRGRGIGSRLLGEVERLAAALGYAKITLSPWPLEQGYPQAKLIAWYKRHGVERPDFPARIGNALTA
jgi:ribosomal protein S18 acetylase RimI-like enzyme